MSILDGGIIFTCECPPVEAPPDPTGAMNGSRPLTRDIRFIEPDTENPVITITTPTANPTFTTVLSSKLVGGVATDNVGVVDILIANDRAEPCSIDPFLPGPEVNWSGTVALLLGANVITVTARDGMGNESTAVLTITMIVDALAPDVAFTTPTPPSATTVESALVIQGTASDNVSVVTITCQNSRGPSCTIDAFVPGASVNWTGTANLLPGTNIITVTAIDGNDNQTTAQILVILDLDVVAPVLTVDNPFESPVYLESEEINILGTATDEVTLGWEQIESVECVNDRGNPCVTDPFDPSASVSWHIMAELSGGWNILTITATDGGGNTDQKILNVFCTTRIQRAYSNGMTRTTRQTPILQAQAIEAASADANRVPAKLMIRNHAYPVGETNPQIAFFDLGDVAQDFKRGRITGISGVPGLVVLTNTVPASWDISLWAASLYDNDLGLVFFAGEIDIEFAITNQFRYVVLFVFGGDTSLVTANVALDGISEMAGNNPPVKFAEMSPIP